MGDRINHRGPDSNGVWLDDGSLLGLGHRRLSIHDLSEAGHQPMHSGNDRYVMVFNGEIYNYGLIKKELEEKGGVFNSDSETEVLVSLIDAVGLEEAVSRAEGMFAIALWDRKDKTLSLCRDRLGEKPLYYGWLDSRFVFSSELSAIETLKDELKVSREALNEYFYFGYVPAPKSIYKDIYKLVPGTILTLPLEQDGISQLNFSEKPSELKCSPKAFWTVLEYATKGSSACSLTEPEAINSLDSLLRDVVSDQSDADVPLGAFLSGGVDSSSVVALMQQVNSKPTKTFTIGFKEKGFNEARFAYDIANHLGTDHTELYIEGSDCLDLAPKLSSIYDEPIADSSQIATLLVSELAKQSVTVCLSGDGGDELFAGYNRYIWGNKAWSGLSRLPVTLRRGLGGMLSAVPLSWWGSASKLSSHIVGPSAGQNNFPLKMQKLIALMQCNDISEMYRYLISYWQANALPMTGGENIDMSIFDSAANADVGQFINQAMYWDQLSYLPGDNLTKVDRASMAHSLETRLPLLNHRVVEFAWSTPLVMKLREGQSKWLLRQVLYQYVPKELIERPKMGFSIPVSSWLRGPLKNWSENLMNQMDEAVFDRPLIDKVWRQHISGQFDWGNRLWALLMFLDWFQSRKCTIE